MNSIWEKSRNGAPRRPSRRNGASIHFLFLFFKKNIREFLKNVSPAALLAAEVEDRRFAPEPKFSPCGALRRGGASRHGATRLFFGLQTLFFFEKIEKIDFLSLVGSIFRSARLRHTYV